VTVPDVSAVVVAWNAGDALAACVDSLHTSAQHAGVDLQVVIVDNASSDESVAATTLGAGDTCVRNPLNAGYGVAAAQGMARAEAAWVLLVNPDLVVDPEFFGALAEVLQHVADDVGTLAPELRYAADRELVDSRGLTVDDVGIPAEVDMGTRIGAAPAREVLGGSSGCCLLRMSAVRELGGPEVIFFAYLEDVDLAVRLQRAGYRALYVPGAIAWHEGSASTGEGSPLKTFLVARNRRILFRLNGPYTARARVWRTLIDIGHGVASSSRGARAAPWLGRLDALRERRYTGFLRRSRAAYDPIVSTPPLTPRASFRAALARKRALSRMHRR